MNLYMEKTNSIQDIYRFGELAKSIHNDYLMDFANDYLKNHTYMNGYTLAREFILENYKGLGNKKTNRNYDKFQKSLIYRFSRIISKFVISGKISKYNSNVYKKV